MPKRDVRLYLSDISGAIRNIRSYTKGMFFEQFARDNKTVDAVVRNLEIIGEAAKNIPHERLFSLVGFTRLDRNMIYHG